MASRKRREDENFQEYRKNLKEEAAQLKKYLRGSLIWNSRYEGAMIQKGKNKEV